MVRGGLGVWSAHSIFSCKVCVNAEESDVNNSATDYLTCNPIGRPCCLGIQAQCEITTEEECRFRDGKYHPEATLCSQVS